MRRFRIAGIVGARPQFIKAAALCKAYQSSRLKKKLDLFWIHTGQHYDYTLSDIFFKELSIPKPRYHLGVGSASHAEQTAKILEKTETVLIKEKPDLVLVFGDTNSTLGAALAASKLRIPVAHVEAGLRSFNRQMPEEINRVITDHISDILFCPTRHAKKQLLKEGIIQAVYQVGDVMADILFSYQKRVKPRRKPRTYYLATIHRNINTDDPRKLARIIRALSGLHKKVILPLHPRTRKIIALSRSLSRLLKNSAPIEVISPVSYAEMISLQKYAYAVLTDSGGIQKEAFLLGVPCITLRNETEWVETVTLGRNALCPHPTARTIERLVERMLRKKFMGVSRRIYGDGSASERILKHCEDYLKKSHD